LTDIKIADNVTSIGIGIFAGCSSLKSLTLSNITSGKLSYLFCWNSNSDYFAIPSSLKKVTITEETVVADSAFYSCNNIETVALPDETTSIGSYAFYGCSSLKDFTIPTSVKTIGSYAFSGCTSMYQITLPASLTSIGSNAFNSCFRLYIIYNNSNINVSAGMLNSSYEAYGNTAIGVYDESDKPVIVYDGNYQFLLADDAWYMIDYPTDTSLILPASFNYNDQVITQYALPDNLFRGASEITDIAIPAVITYLGGYCFYQCESLQNLTINNDSTFDSIDMWTFDNCGSLKSFNVPSAVEEICSYAFYNCNNLRSITLPKSLKSIDNTAFYSCSRLYEITNYSTLNIVCGDNSYGNVASYALAVYKSDDDKKADFFTYANADMAYYNGTITLIGVADDVISISLPTITYSENYTTCNIATEAFKNSNLQQVLIGVNINTVGDWAFGYNYNLSEVKFTGTVKSFGSYAFYNCGSLKTVTLPEGLTKIGDSAFYYCSNLAKVTLPKSLTDLGENAFSNCSGITSIEIPDGVKTINSGTFRYCTRLLSVLIPSSVTSIANGAFDGCNHLIVVYNLSSLNIVAGSNSNGNVAYYAIKVLNDTSYKIDYCDDGNYYFCKIDDEWYLYSYSTNLSTPYKLPESFVYDNKKITSYTIKNGTFNYYVNSIVIPTSVNAIQDGAFSGLNNIFFKGTAEEWDKLGANVRYNNVYYYSECVHEYGYWTYYNDGIVSAPSFSQIEERTATCTQEGLVKTVCNYCNKTISEDKIAMIDHEPDDKGICKMCGKDLNAKEPTEDLSCDN
jgi:hypothetical protein